MNPIELPIDDIEAGAKAAADVVDASGQVLIGEGVSLNQATLEQLRRRGIESVLVWREPDLTDQDRQRQAAQLRARIERRFRRSSGTEAIRKLREILLAHHLREYTDR